VQGGEALFLYSEEKKALELEANNYNNRNSEQLESQEVSIPIIIY
jgi:hypothetical protein